jgi:Tfp pilus assembly protein PilE
MRALSLDFRDNKPWLTRSGWIALLLVCAILAQMTWHYSVVVERSEAQQARLDAMLERAHPARMGRHLAQNPRFEADMSAARKVLIRLDQPWDRLFSAVESAAGNDIALLGINPDPARGVVRITGEAKQYEDVLAYARRLEANKSLTGIHLENHQVQSHDPEQPVRFTIGAYWSAGS